MKTVRMCKTEFRLTVKEVSACAKHLTTGRCAKVLWDDSLGMLDNYARAAAELFGREPEFCAAVEDGGYIFGVDPANDPTEKK